MTQYDGIIILKTSATDAGKVVPKMLDTEEYLNGKVSAETLRRFGVQIRVHVGEPHHEEG